MNLAKRLDIRGINFYYLSAINRKTLESSNYEMGLQMDSSHSFVDIIQSFIIKRNQVDLLDDIQMSIREKAVI